MKNFKKIAEDYFGDKIPINEIWENPGVEKSASKGIYFVTNFEYSIDETSRRMYAKWVTDADGYGDLLLEAEPLRFVESVEEIYEDGNSGDESE